MQVWSCHCSQNWFCRMLYRCFPGTHPLYSRELSVKVRLNFLEELWRGSPDLCGFLTLQQMKSFEFKDLNMMNCLVIKVSLFTIILQIFTNFTKISLYLSDWKKFVFEIFGIYIYLFLFPISSKCLNDRETYSPE